MALQLNSINSELTARQDTPMDGVTKRGPHAQVLSRKEHAMCQENYRASIDLPAAGTERGVAGTGSRNRLFNTTFVFTLAACLLLPTIAFAAGPHGKRPSSRSWHGYGFLPGYQPPEVIEWETARGRRPTFWYGGPGYYRGRWNGGGFGPCWTPTPIGPHWNCG
jgi:hypothetical protein